MLKATLIECVEWGGSQVQSSQMLKVSYYTPEQFSYSYDFSGNNLCECKLEQTSDNNTCHFNNNDKKQTIIVMHWSNWIVRHTQVRMSKLFYIRPQHLDRYRSSFAVGKLSRLLVVSSFEFTLKSQCFDLSGSCSKGLKIDYENITCIKTRIKIESWINWKLNIVKHFED